MTGAAGRDPGIDVPAILAALDAAEIKLARVKEWFRGLSLEGQARVMDRMKPFETQGDWDGMNAEMIAAHDEWKDTLK